MTAECEAMLYAASRAQHVSEVIKPAVKRGAIVLCDRFLDSSLVYQGVGRGLGMGAVRALNRLGVDGCEPDLTLFYDISPERAMQRRRAASAPDRLELEEKAFFEAVYGAYRALAAEDPERIAVIDADRPIDAVETDTRRCLAETLDRPARR